MELSHTESVFLELLQVAIWDKKPNIDLFSGLTSEDWEELIPFSVKQGVQAIIFDGVLRLPENLHPPRNLKLKWIVNVDTVEKRFDRHLNTCADLVNLYAQNDIKMMVLKGIGLAYQYPVPSHREGGDIDIWLFGDYERGNQVMKEQGIEMDHADQKHLLFYFQNIPIENHRKFSNEHRYKVDLMLEDALNQVLKREEPNTVTLPKNTSVFTPPPTFNAIFLARHMIVHFSTGICARHLCDWAMFLEKNHGKYDIQYLIEEFRRVGMLDLVTAFSKICIKYIGLPERYNPFVEVETSELEEKLIKDVLRLEKYEINTSNPFKVLFHKWRRFYRNRWKYELVHGISMPKIVCAYIKVHIRNPFSVFEKT